ncbi:hypothetical protein [Alkalicoccobacillus plakortidis]|uniref:DUF4878 domain-containing protein n=1 Tax=Alkalicoccobacillus plakortidis TaxID=444060 RepID=A0ABT0XK91_9BACI|nr:hypothetical protein [Alkalicoccobacillus plakortidis]MCM2676313.1 hypothetical protein [Alkalicoccobacillus plakortidis]
MKGKIVFLSTILVFGLGGYGTANAEESENLIQLTPEEITEFQEYGFHEGQLVEGLTQELYETYKGAEVEAFDKVIYEYIEDNDGSVEYEVVTEEVYESRSAENEFGLLNETEDSGWIILELTVSNVGGGERMVQNSFTFQGHSPSSTFRDAV